MPVLRRATPHQSCLVMHLVEKPSTRLVTPVLDRANSSGHDGKHLSNDGFDPGKNFWFTLDEPQDD